jgi:hypothetical protein
MACSSASSSAHRKSSCVSCGFQQPSSQPWEPPLRGVSDVVYACMLAAEVERREREEGQEFDTCIADDGPGEPQSYVASASSQERSSNS